MSTINDISSLKREIALLENRQVVEKQMITDEFSLLIEKMKPANIIRGLFHSVNSSPGLKADLLHGVIGMGTGFLTNKVLLGSLSGSLKKILGIIVQAGITNAAVKYPDAIKSKGINFLTKVLQAIRIKSSNDVEREHFTGGSQL